MHSVHYEPPGGGPPSFVSIFIASTLPRVSVLFCWARRARQKCTETRGKVDAINSETKEGGPRKLNFSAYLVAQIYRFS